MAEKTVHHKRVVDTGGTTGVIATIGASYTARIRELTVYVAFPPGASAGTFVVESGPHEDYAGTWVTEATLTSADDTAKKASVTGLHGAIRVRNTVAVAGSTNGRDADVDIYMN